MADTAMRSLERQAKEDPSMADQLRWERVRAGQLTPRTLKIGDETFTVEDVRELGWTGMVEITTEEGEDFIVAEDSQTAGEAARERWADMAEHDPEEFECMVGAETLVKWALGQSAGPGCVHVTSLSEWLDLHINHPEEEWAGYDGEERDVEDVSPDLDEEIGFVPTVAYRTN